MRGRRIPIFSLVLIVIGAAMAGPAIMAAADGEWRVARGFLYSGIFTVVAAALMGLALANRGHGGSARRELGILLLCWLIAPIFAAVPLILLTPSIGIWGAVFEMTAAFTTTGGTVYGNLEGLPRAINLWRGLVGWLGGFMTLGAAYVALAPRQLGGFEIEAATWQLRAGQGGVSLGASLPPLEVRVIRAMRVIIPIYALLTAVLGLGLSATGESELDSMIHAMAILSTSGISAHPEGLAATPNVGAEMLAAVFLMLAISRRIYSDAAEIGSRMPLRRDPELLTMLGFLLAVTLTLFLRHWIGAYTLDATGEPVDPFEATWGMFFTVLSFLSTTGFVSGFWDSARDWSGWANPGLILLALAAIGGGAATTAGGIKLIRAYALMRHGLREVERIAQPYSVIGVGARTRSLLREGPAIVWAFMMLFIFAIAVSMLGLTALRMGFEEALVASIAGIANTGPAFALVAEVDGGFSTLTDPQRAILGTLMIVGRIETLALIALFNPDAWQSSRDAAQRGGKSRPDTPQSPW
ncbi:MAG: potassium transporter TrkG [Pseudomonadota bacterium]